jgi:integrase
MLTIRKRGRYWHCRGTIRVGKETRDVKEHSTGCTEKQTAKEYRDKYTGEIREELLSGTSGRARLLTFADAGLAYINRPDGTHKMDLWRVGELNEHMGDHLIADVKDGWRVFMEKRCSNLAPATVERFRKVAQAAINQLCRDHDIVAPKLPPIKFKNDVIRFLSIADQERLIKSYAVHVQPIALTLCYQGLRTQEALQLNWTNVNFQQQTLYINRTKNGEPRMVPMHPRVLEAIHSIHRARDFPSEGHVFLNRLGKPYADTRDYKYPGGNPIAKAHKTACKRAGITNFRPHDWRHHWASQLVMKGVGLETVKKLGGWKSLDMVLRYAAVSAEHEAEAIRKLA